MRYIVESRCCNSPITETLCEGYSGLKTPTCDKCGNVCDIIVGFKQDGV